MFSKKSMHITLAFVLLIALASLGLAFGFWNETLQINGTVETGDLDVAFEILGPAAEYDPGNAASCTYALGPDGNSLIVTITDAYPWYECGLQVKIVNNGTVPVNLTGPTAISLPSWLMLQSPPTTNPLPVGGEIQFTNMGLSFYVDETAPEGVGPINFRVDFYAEQVH